MKQKFSLKDVVVVSGNDEDEDTQLAMMGLHGAQLLDRLLEPWRYCRFFPGPRGERTG